MTGGASGIGRALAEVFHAQGNTVIVAGRRRAALDAVVAANPGMIAMELDVADPAAVTAFAAAITAAHPALNVVVNNAGIMVPEQMTAAPREPRRRRGDGGRRTCSARSGSPPLCCRI